MIEFDVISLQRQKRRKSEMLKSRYATFIASPQMLVGGIAPAISNALVLPANAYLAVSSDVSVTSGDVVINIAGGRVLGTPTLIANELHEIGFFELGREVTLEKTIAGAATITLYFLDRWKRPSIIASSTFT